MIRMYHSQHKVLIYVTPKYVSAWEELGFTKMKAKIIAFPALQRKTGVFGEVRG